jgi:dihydroorotate dehydrogenase (fumarate)
MDLSTKYLGLDLAHPLMPGASPMVDDLDTVRRLEDAGASAIVMHSLFEEQIAGEHLASIRNLESHGESSAEARSYFPQPDEYRLGPEEYLDQIRKIRDTVSLPVIASINGVTPGGWLRYAKLIEEAGANALELNVYYLATNPDEDGTAVESRAVDITAAVKRTVGIPVAVKLSPFFSSIPSLARKLDAAGADGLVLFNRFYQPDIDVELLEAVRTLHLSDSSELLLRLRWLAILFGRVRPSLAVTGGVHTGLDAVKAVMAGAGAVQLVSALFRRGPAHLRTVLQEMSVWMGEHEYESLEQMKGSMSLRRCPDPHAYERANYMHILQSWDYSLEDRGAP